MPKTPILKSNSEEDDDEDEEEDHHHHHKKTEVASEPNNDDDDDDKSAETKAEPKKKPHKHHKKVVTTVEPEAPKTKKNHKNEKPEDKLMSDPPAKAAPIPVATKAPIVEVPVVPEPKKIKVKKAKAPKLYWEFYYVLKVKADIVKQVELIVNKDTKVNKEDLPSTGGSIKAQEKLEKKIKKAQEKVIVKQVA